jgi:hypothetical protein
VKSSEENFSFLEALATIGNGIYAFTRYLKQLEVYLKQPEVTERILAFIENVQKFPCYERKANALLAEYGWYTNWYSPFDISSHLVGALEGDLGKLNSTMETHLTEDWGNLTRRILGNYPNRSEILTVAFRLHEEGNYIASIPLFLAQSDGIVYKEFNHSVFGKRNGYMLIQETLEQKIESGEIEKDGILDIYYEALRIQNDFSKKSNHANKQMAPNRHGVLHGLEEHLNYGTRQNSLKAFSLLAYLDSMFNEE